MKKVNISSDYYSKMFTKYVINLNLNPAIENVLISQDFLTKNHQFYLYYPKLFSNAFEIDEKDVDLLCIAGYLYYQSTLNLDSVIDEKKFSNLILVNIGQEETIKILTSLFGRESIFWSYWNKRRDEYYVALKLERDICSKEIITIEDYLQIADFKASFGKAAIDTVFTLSKNKDKNTHQLLLKSHEYFSLAFQLNDDILDFKEDVLAGQFNWAHHLLMKNHDIRSSDVKILNKYIYIKGITTELFLIAINYLEKALDVIKSIDVPLWKFVINDLLKKFKTSIVETENYLAILNSEIVQSSICLPDNNLQIGIQLATEYIRSKQKKDGSWHEYVNQGGISNAWSTSFIVSKRC